MAAQSRAPGVPVSLVQPSAENAADRRAIKSADAANGEPEGSTAGFFAQGRRWLHIVVSLPDAATSITWKLWTWDSVSELWTLDTRPGTGGTVALSDTDDDNPQRNLIEIDGVDRVYIELDDFVGVFTEGVDVWLSANGIVEGG